MKKTIVKICMVLSVGSYGQTLYKQYDQILTKVNEDIVKANKIKSIEIKKYEFSGKNISDSSITQLYIYNKRGILIEKRFYSFTTLNPSMNKLWQFDSTKYRSEFYGYDTINTQSIINIRKDKQPTVQIDYGRFVGSPSEENYKYKYTYNYGLLKEIRIKFHRYWHYYSEKIIYEYDSKNLPINEKHYGNKKLTEIYHYIYKYY